LTGTAVATGLAAFFLFTARLMEVMNAFTTEKLPVHARQTMDSTSPPTSHHETTLWPPGDDVELCQGSNPG
jgi:hypothetical protein